MQEDVKSFDDTSDRPKGWAEIKLRRVYLKEWEDRKNDLDEDDIMDKRYARELEVKTTVIFNNLFTSSLIPLIITYSLF